MVAYSFAPQFAPQVEAMTKCQTVRGHRKRHARPGEPMQLYAGMRTRQCRKLVDLDPVCMDVRNIAIEIAPKSPLVIASIEIEGIALDDNEIEAFAIADGFGRNAEGWARKRMGIFWWKNHQVHQFEGVVLRWRHCFQ